MSCNQVMTQFDPSTRRWFARCRNSEHYKFYVGMATQRELDAALAAHCNPNPED